MMCVKAHELIAEKTNYPLHVGITESGTLISGNIKSSIDTALKYRNSYLKGKSDEEVSDCLGEVLRSEATNLKPYFPDFMKDAGLLIDAVIFLQSPSSSCD